MVGTMIVSLLSTLGILLIVLCAAGAVLLPAGGKGYSVLFADGARCPESGSEPISFCCEPA